MSVSFKSLFGAIRRSGIYGSLLTSLNNEVRKYNNTPDYIDLEFLYLYIWKNKIENSFYILVHAKCSDSHYRTGFSSDDIPIIYKCHGFETFDGAFGFMTEQVEQAIIKFKSTRFLFYPNKNTQLYNTASIHEYDYLTKSWIPYSICIYKCDKCGFEISLDESSKLLNYDCAFLCSKCGSDDMNFSRYKFKEHNQVVR